MRKILLGMLALLFLFSVQAQESHINAVPLSPSLTGVPVLTAKAKETVDRKDIFTYQMSYLNADVLKAFEEIKALNKPGTFIAYQFLSFEVDETANTLKLSIAAGTATQQEVMQYLQKSLQGALGKN